MWETGTKMVDDVYTHFATSSTRGLRPRPMRVVNGWDIPHDMQPIAKTRACWLEILPIRQLRQQYNLKQKLCRMLCTEESKLLSAHNAMKNECHHTCKHTAIHLCRITSYVHKWHDVLRLQSSIITISLQHKNAVMIIWRYEDTHAWYKTIKISIHITRFNYCKYRINSFTGDLSWTTC